MKPIVPRITPFWNCARRDEQRQQARARRVREARPPRRPARRARTPARSRGVERRASSHVDRRDERRDRVGPHEDAAPLDAVRDDAAEERQQRARHASARSARAEIASARSSVATRSRMKSGTVTDWMPTPVPARSEAAHQRANAGDAERVARLRRGVRRRLALRDVVQRAARVRARSRACVSWSPHQSARLASKAGPRPSPRRVG